MAQLKIDHDVLKDENILYIQNDRIRLGINLGLGGAVTYLAEHGRKNLINSFDWGRQVQMSFYSYPVPYHPEGHDMNEGWRFIGWNPIQCGDCYGHRSTILEHRVSENEIYVKCIPMHWPLDNMPGECTFETWYRLEGNRVAVTARLNNARPDTTPYAARGQELPAVYTNGEWYKLVSYIGTQPFTGGPLSELCTKDNGLGWPWIGYRPTENWAALVDDDNYGLGVYNGETTNFIGGFAGKMGAGGPKDSPTGYISPVLSEIIDHNIVYTYRYQLIVGTLSDIRAAAGELHADAPALCWSFEEDRAHFFYKNITDAGWPVKGCLDFDFGADGVLCGPPIFAPAASVRTLVLDAAFTSGESIPCTLRLSLYDGKSHEREYVYPVTEVPLTLCGDGCRRQYAVDISGVTQPIINFALAFGGSGHANVYGVRLR